MSTSDSVGKVSLPAGVTVGPGRETSELNAQGQLVQGMKFPLTTANGSTTSVFVPFSEIHDTTKVASIISQRVNAIMAIGG